MATRTKRDKFPFSTWLQKCTPRLWVLRVVANFADEFGDVRRTNVQVPEDRDLAGAMAAANLPRGRYQVAPLFAAKLGESFSTERTRIGLVARQQIERGVVEVTADAGGPPPGRDPSLVASKAARERARMEAEQEEERARQAEARTRRLKAERDGAAQEQPQHHQSNELSAVVQLLVQQQQAQQALMLQLLEQGRAEAAAREERMMQLLMQQQQAEQHQAPPAPSGGIGGLLEQIKQLAEVKELLRGELGDDKAEADPESIVGIIQAVRGLLPALQGQQQLPAPVAARMTPPPPQLNGSAPPARNVGTERVQQFVAAALQEFGNGSDPAAVAGELVEHVGLLPLPVRAGLQAGDWHAAWRACAQYTNAAEWKAADDMLQQAPAAQQWFSSLAAAVQYEMSEEAADGE